MRKSMFVLMSVLSLSVLGTIKVAKAYTGRGINYSEYFASSGWNTPKHLVVELWIDDEPEDHFGPYNCVNNASGIDIGSTGNNGNTKHDVYAYFYVVDASNPNHNIACMSNMTNTGPVDDSLHLQKDNYNYNVHFYGASGYSDGYRMYFKKSWNDTWSGTLSGYDYVFETANVPNDQ